ncbi:long-chain fatty acid--CoA ligase [Streptosporangiaceae bacterium NEAU-GS5]|nr:long-chain fatty acid--CoA ligase [Streptosporangiaceae bacterium NEAU-GS5]
MRTDETAADDLYEHASRDPGGPAVSARVAGFWTPITWRDLVERVTAIARGVIAAGVLPEDRVAIMAPTSLEWMLCDYAIWAAGAVSVPIYETSSPEQIRWILAHSEAVAVFAGDASCAELIERVEPPAVRHVWPMDRLDALADKGRAVPAQQVMARRSGVTARSVATIVYTSGTTGPPKGCALTHANLVAEVRAVLSADGIADRVLTKDASILLFLPPAHIFARIVQLAAIRSGALLAHTSDIKNVAAEMRSFQPTVMLAVPRVLEKAYNAALLNAARQGHSRMFAAAARTAIAYSRSHDRGTARVLLWAQHAMFDRLVYRRLREAMGGRLAYAVSGAAPLGARLGHFFRGAGITVLEGWGLTETAAGHTFNLPGGTRMGSVGRPLPGCAVRVAPDGEILVRGRNVIKGYWRDEVATEAAFDRDGWFRTGDVGELDDDGYLWITGRKKEIIITSSGKNVAPAVLEDRVRAHWIVDHCVVVGDARPYVGALVTIDTEAYESWRLTGSAVDLHTAVQEAIDQANRMVSHAEAIKRFRILDHRFVVGEELTPTQKVRRTHVLAKYVDEVDALYS